MALTAYSSDCKAGAPHGETASSSLAVRSAGSSSSSSPSPASSCGAGGPWWPKGLLQVDSRRLATCPPGWLLFIVLAAALLRIADGCSSRSTPKPRPPQSTVRPNITFQTYTCPETYAKWYCLNGATCFSIKIGESILYNCECADGYMGQRCEFKDLDGTYLPTRQRVLIETASIAGGVTVAVILVFIVCVTVYLYYRRRKDKTYFDVPDEPKLFFCDRKNTTCPQPQLVLRQSDLEQGRVAHLCEDGQRSSS
ncbi:protein spitz-like isoform X3 [Dermacentor albipictus]|uniref:protein spitz-like isoform X3 n=1 Tax=Dermacentor albipictus TaxID=60249 RepID=UPI0038FC5DDC